MASEAPRFFKTSAFLALTIGVPFCVFKWLFGLLLVRNGYAFWGYLCMTWSTVDFFMNLIRSVQDILGNPDPAIQFCLFGQAGKAIKRLNLLMAIDTFLSFCIILFVLWSGWIAQLHRIGLYFWLGATSVNLLSLAIMNIWIIAMDGEEN